MSVCVHACTCSLRNLRIFTRVYSRMYFYACVPVCTRAFDKERDQSCHKCACLTFALFLRDFTSPMPGGGGGGKNGSDSRGGASTGDDTGGVGRNQYRRCHMLLQRAIPHFQLGLVDKEGNLCCGESAMRYICMSYTFCV